MGDGFMGGLLPHFFVFDIFGNFHLDSMKNLLEVLRFFPLLNLGGKKFEKKSSGWPSCDLKSAVVIPHKSNYYSQNVVIHFPLPDFRKIRYVCAFCC